MNLNDQSHGVLKALGQELAGFHLMPSPLASDFSLDVLMAEATSCRVVKANDRRKIFHISTPRTGYYLKLSTMLRRKDRWRHFFLPSRKWAEWRNLHRLSDAQILAAKPVLKGENKTSRTAMFFLLTEEVRGQPLEMSSSNDARQLGAFVAMLHSRGVYHADLHADNIILSPESQCCLVDVQEVYFLAWIPRRLRLHNLGKIFFNLGLLDDIHHWGKAFLEGYQERSCVQFHLIDLNRSAIRQQQKKFRSRTKRCCKNSTEFLVVQSADWRGYKRRTLQWEAEDLRQALKKGRPLKGAHVIFYEGVCIKKHPRRRFHGNRCLTSWKMSRALEVRGIAVPRALGYFIIDRLNCFLAELLVDRLHLNTYLSSISDERAKRRALKKLALWLRKFYDTNVWQRDFKSSNILCQYGEYFMVDLDGVKIRRLTAHHQIINLAQLNASLSNTITLKDRLRFYHYFSAAQQMTRAQRRAVYQKVWDISRTKNTSIYDLDLDKLWIRHP
jgi:tRNA A-37 threonylcarbamoyl transferase component Bud32